MKSRSATRRGGLRFFMFEMGSIGEMSKRDKSKAGNQTVTEPELYSPDHVEYFRGIIMERRNKILKVLDQLTEATRNTVQEYSGSHSTYSLHMADQGTDAQEREKAFLFASREGKYLKYLDRALKMLDEGTYGYCDSCGDPIQKKRLELVPTSRLCIACKLKEEQSRSR